MTTPDPNLSPEREAAGPDRRQLHDSRIKREGYRRGRLDAAREIAAEADAYTLTGSYDLGFTAGMTRAANLIANNLDGSRWTEAQPGETLGAVEPDDVRPQPQDLTAPDPSQIVRDWMAHLGYEPEEIAAAEAEPDHSECERDEDGTWFCLDDGDVYRHNPVYIGMRDVAHLVMFTLEHPARVGICGEQAPGILPHWPVMTCGLPAGHAGWHEEADEHGAKWTDARAERDAARAELAEARAEVENAQALITEVTVQRDLLRHNLSAANARSNEWYRWNLLMRGVVAAAQAWVARCHREPGNPNHPNGWADEADFALLVAVDAYLAGGTVPADLTWRGPGCCQAADDSDGNRHDHPDVGHLTPAGAEIKAEVPTDG